MGGEVSPCNVVSDWWKHKGGFFTKALGKGAMGSRHSAAQTLDRGGAMQSPRSDPMTLALKTTSNASRHSGGSGRPFPEHKDLSQYICVFSGNCSVLIKLS